MQLFRQLPERQERRAVLVGNCDGVHRGHQALIRRLVEQASHHNAIPTLLTFHPHPRRFFKKDGITPLLTPLKQKIERLNHSGIRQCVILPFRHIRHLSPQEFIDDILIDGLGVTFLLTGEGFRFGRKAQGTVQDLTAAALHHDFDYEAHSQVLDEQLGKQRISSRRIRAHLQQGEMEAASHLLGNSWEIGGRVVYGAGLGQSLGVPTANIKIHPHILHPRYGSYAATIALDDAKLNSRIWHGGVVYWGRRPFYDGRTPSLEAHIFNIEEQSLYGRVLTLRLLRFLRHDEDCLDTADLQQKMQQDIIKARQCFSLLGSPS